MPHKDPHAVLGVEAGATPEEIKTAWRMLARRHHPDLTGDDPELARRATRRMAEINAAYAALTRAGETAEGRRPRGATGNEGDAPGGATRGARSAGAGRPPWPPPEPATRPITGRLDTSGTVRQRNQVTTPPGVRLPLTGQPPLRYGRSVPELRASQPSGPTERGWSRDHVHREPPTLEDALLMEVGFGKFHGHSLGAIADFEPSYIDWLATTVTREPEVAMAARVIVADLDRRGVRRPHRPTRPGWQSNPFR